MIMDNLFSCNPNCSIANLTLLDWSVVFGLLLLVFSFTTLLRKWAFSSNQVSVSSLKWHLPRFFFVALVLAAVTIPVIWMIFGYTGARLYGQFVYPGLAFVVYMLWGLG